MQRGIHDGFAAGHLRHHGAIGVKKSNGSPHLVIAGRRDLENGRNPLGRKPAAVLAVAKVKDVVRGFAYCSKSKKNVKKRKRLTPLRKNNFVHCIG